MRGRKMVEQSRKDKCMIVSMFTALLIWMIYF